MSDNIEERIKDAIKNKLKSNDKLDEKTTELINKLFEIFPDLKDEPKKNKQIETVTPNINDDKNEIVLEEITYNNILYYKDKHNGVWDTNTELVGVYNKGQVLLFNIDELEITNDI